MPPRTRSLAEFLERCRALVDDGLDRWTPPLGSPPPVLHEAIRYSLLSPGKRIRGAVVIAAAELSRGNADNALPLACAVEMVHSASLILDDLPAMDNASMRRGKACLHLRVNEANAIMAAVALLMSAFERIQTAEGLKDRARLAMTTRLARAIGAQGLVGGQVVDLESTGSALELGTLEWIHRHKTGELFMAAAELGSLSAGSRARDREALRRYAKNLGLAFQITDDLLDYSGDPATTGKDAGLDRDKTTFVDLCGIEGARRLVDELIDAAVAALSACGRRGAILVELAEFVRSRDR